MIDHRTLEKRLNRNQLRPMTNDEFDAVVRARKELTLNAIPYPVCALEYAGKESTSFKDLDEFLTYKDLKERPDKQQLFDRFKELVQKKYELNVMDYCSLAEFAIGMLHHYGSFEKIPRMRGFLADFIRACQHPPIIGPPNNEPIKVEGDLVQVDRCGSYTSVYSKMKGIPTGDPLLIVNWPGVVIEEKSYYFAKIDIKSFKCKHAQDPYPMITEPGIMFVDKTWMECLFAHYDMEYSFICGYYFRGVQNTIRGLAEDLWALRMKLKSKGDDLQLLIKRVLNCMWGKTLWKGKPVHDEYIEPEQLEQYIEEHPLIYSHRKSGTKIRARLIKPVYQPWQRPQFGIVVMSHGRVVMQDAIYRAVDDGIDVYYCNTDSLLIKREDLSRIRIPLGEKLGEFHMEYEMKKFICLSAKR
jgi:hypothetical protein